MPGMDFDGVLKSLTNSEVLDEGQIEMIAIAGEAVIGWDVDEYMKTFQVSRLEAIGTQRLVRDAFNAMGVTTQQEITIPEAPPYLVDPGHAAIFEKKRGEAGTLIEKSPADTGDYDPTDQTQFARIGDQFFRWDGQRSERYPFGQAHEIVFVEHKIVNGIQVPDAAQAVEATARGQGWFHKGYGCWIRPNGKRSAKVSQEVLMKVRSVIGPRARAAA